jgi:hypothetical protein
VLGNFASAIAVRAGPVAVQSRLHSSRLEVQLANVAVDDDELLLGE